MSNDGNAATMRDQDMASEMTIAAMSDDAFRDAMRFPVTLGCVRHTPTSA